MRLAIVAGKANPLSCFRSSKAATMLLAAPLLLACSGDPGTSPVDEDSGRNDALVSPDQSSAKDGSVADTSVVDSAPRGDAGPAADRQKPISIDSKVAPPNGYWEYLPPYYDGTTQVPLLVFWHGLGENGNGIYSADAGTGDLKKVLANGPPKLIAANQWPNERPFIVLSPQHSNGGCPSADEIDKFITFALGHYAVDPKRIYLTGLSCGAIGSWQYVTKYKDKAVAATLVISGDPGNAWATDGCSLVTDLALWSVHGDKDPTVAYQPDHDELQNLLACPKPRADVRWNEVVNGGHDVWTTTYDLSAGRGDVYAWMLANPKP